MSGLRVEAHLRGHVASCNGRVELVKARAELHSRQDCGSCSEAQELQARAEEARRRKEEQLLSFQRAVKERVRRRERARQKQLSEVASKHVFTKKQSHLSCQGIRIKRRNEAGGEREEVAVVVVEPRTAVQQARLSLLTASHLIPHRPSHHPSHTPPTSSPDQVPSRMATPVSPPPPPSEERSAARMFTAPSQLALNQCQSHARQLHLFHKLYSNIERETTRQRRMRQALQGSAERRRRENEVQRRVVEEGLAGEDSLLSEASLVEREMERLEEWEQTVALERRRHQLQTARETERYVEALRAQLQERLASCPTPPPPLCSCGSTLWDTDPQTCANNCPFYRNPRAYAAALGGLLSTLKH